MSEPLTDEQLVELVQHKSPEELTEGEVERLRARLRDSPELQTTLVDRLHMESYLHAALGEFKVSRTELARRVAEVGSTRSRRLRYGTGMGLLGLLALLIGFGWWNARDAGGDGVDGETVAEADTDVETDTDAPSLDGGPKRSGREGDAADAEGDTGAAADDVATEPPAGGEPFVSVVEAEEFVHSNLVVDDERYGRGIGVLVDGGEEPRFAEYVFDVPRAGVHQLELRYASDEKRPLRLSLNGEPVRSDAAAEDTGSWGPPGQRAFAEARLALEPGRNVIRLESPGPFPHLDKVGLASVPDAAGPQTEKTGSLPVLALRTRPMEDDPQTLIAEGPWATLLDPAVEPVAFEDVCFDNDFPESFESFPRSRLEAWLEQVPGRPFRLHEKEFSGHHFGGVEGAARLRAPWPREAVLRTALFDLENFHVSFWNGDAGVLLVAEERNHAASWAAYAVTRENANAEPDPKSRTLLTSDNGRHRRAAWGLFDVRWQSGALVLTRGAVKLLQVPLAEPPTDVVFGGRGYFRGLAMYRGEPVPATPPNPRRLLARAERPGDLTWSVEPMPEEEVSLLVEPEAAAPWSRELAEGVTLSGTEEGAFELSVAEAEKTVRVTTPLPDAGLQEVVVRFGGADVGTGLFLADSEGEPIVDLAVLHDKRNDRVSFDVLKPPSSHTDWEVNPKRHPYPGFGPGQWFRVVLGFGTVKVFTSGDGVHWGHGHQMGLPDDATRIGGLGLFCRETVVPRSVRLRSFEVRELTGVTDWAPAAVRNRVPLERFADVSGDTFETWFRKVLGSRPGDVSLADWRRACAVVTLDRRPGKSLAATLLYGLLEDAITTPGPVGRRLRLFEEAALLVSLNNGKEAGEYVSSYERLGLQLVEERRPQPFRTILEARMRHPVWSQTRLPLDMPDLARADVFAGVFGDDPEAVAEACESRRFYLTPSAGNGRRSFLLGETRTPFVWAELSARRELGLPPVSELPVYDRGWRHPLISQLTKEAFNVMAEFESAIGGEAWEDACRIVAATDAAGMTGLLPASGESGLLVSLPRAVASAMEEHPELRRTMQETLGPVAAVRVRRAIAESDAEAVAAATVRYLGTEAAATAHAWLGDRAMASGRFEQAAERYRSALDSVSSTERASVAARLRLARAMLGQGTSEAESGEVVELGGRRVSSASFDSLVQEFRETNASPTPVIGVQSIDDAEAPLFDPGPLKVETRGKFDGHFGNNADRRGDPPGVDLVARELAVTVDGNDLFVSNRFQLGMFDANTGQRKWLRELGGDRGEAKEWPLTNFRPLVVGDHVFVRRIAKHGGQIVRVRRDNGEPAWQTDVSLSFASDPVVSAGKLVALVADEPLDGIRAYDLAVLDAETGGVTARFPLLRCRDVWREDPPCRIAVTASGDVIGVVAGTVVRTDVRGTVHWLRPTDLVPPALGDASRLRPPDVPVLCDGRVFVTQPAMQAVSCLDAETGGRLWHRAEPALQRLVGAVGDVLVARTNEGFVAWNRADGEPAWRIEAESLLDAAVVGTSPEGRGWLLFARRGSAKSATPPRAELVWADAATGDVQRRRPLDELVTDQTKRVALGPFVTTPERLWAFHSGREKELARELVAFEVAEDGTSPIPPVPVELTSWATTFRPERQAQTDRFAPGWALVSAATHGAGDAGLVPKLENETDVFVTKTSSASAALFVRRLDVPETPQPRLRMRMAARQGQRWRLTVTAGGRTLHDAEVIGEEQGIGWRTTEVHLAPLAGQTVWLTVSHAPSAGGEAGDALWKTLEVVP